MQAFFFRLGVDYLLLAFCETFSAAFLNFLSILYDSANEVVSVLHMLQDLVLELDAVIFQNLLYVNLRIL